MLRLAKWLTERGHQIILYGYEGSPLYEQALAAGIPVRHFKSTFKHGDLINAYRLSRLLTADEVDVLLLHERKDIMLGALTRYSSSPDFKLLYMQHMHIGVDKKDLYHTWLYGNLDCWIVPLGILRERLLSKTNYPEERVAVIPFGIELERFTEKLPDKTAARAKLELPQEAIVLGMVGRLEEEKNQETLIKALPMLHQRGIEAHALILGDETLHEENRYREYLLKLIEDSGLADQVHLRPFRPDTETAYAAIDIFTLTSKSETYGMVTIEAMASGLPLIGTRHGGTREIIKHGQNGLLIERERPEELTAAVARLLTDADFRDRIAAQARADAVANYSYTRQCELFEALVDRLNSEGRRSGRA